MLTHLHVQNFIIIDQLNLEFNQGLTVITGETGAGKSIVIDALSLILGARADSAVIGPHTDKCDLSACFDIKQLPSAKEWLQENEYGEEPWTECIIRRIIHRDGKSRQFINGFNCTLAQLKEFTNFLMTIHSQNQHQLLTKRSHQRDLIDCFNTDNLQFTVIKQAYQQWTDNNNEIKKFAELQNNDIQRELLEYQIEEFEKVAISAGEYEQLDEEHKSLANAEQIIAQCQHALDHLTELEKSSAQHRLYQAQNYLQPIQKNEKITLVSELLSNAIVHLDEAAGELRNYLSHVEINPERLNLVEQRLSKLHELARKYQTSPHELLTVETQLTKQLRDLKEASQRYQLLQTKSEEYLKIYQEAAQKLHQSRVQTASILNKQINAEIQRLGMPGGEFKAMVNFNNEITPSGSDEVEFLVATNPGQTLQPLSKVASGGEISRIALAIYVATAQNKTTPILVFDEVDVGIGGGTAAIVGSLLKSLSKSAQILCITHLPQVAAYGDQHMCVQKETANNSTVANIKELKEEQRIKEIARMLGGITITEKTIAHAKELIECQ